MAVTAEQMLAALVQSMTGLQEAVATMTKQSADRKKDRGEGRVLDVKHRQIPQFSGGTGGQYDDWAFAFKRVVRSINVKAYDMLVAAEGGATKKEIEEDVDFDGEDVGKYSAEIFDLLCQALAGEPLQAVRSVDDMEGLAAWYKLASKYSPRSMARAVRLVGQVTNPPKILDLKRAEAELDKWEELVKTLKRDFGEKFSDTVKVGIVATMMPISVQELIYQSVGKTADYDQVIQKVRAVVSNKVAMMAGNGPTPMDVGEVWDHGEPTCRQCYDDEQEGDVGAVSANTQCHGCGGWGHLKRDCPSVGVTRNPKGKGKGKGLAQEWGKGTPKGSGGAPGKGAPKGAPKGSFKGSCFVCGKPGHRATECQVRHANAVDGGHEEGENEEIGGVWTIGAVDEMKPKLAPAKMAVPPGLGSARLPQSRSRNSFQALAEPDEVEGYRAELRAGYAAIGEAARALAARGAAAAPVMAVDMAMPLTRMSSIEFNVADVRKPLASAAKMVRSGNRVVLDSEGSYIQNKSTGETMEVKIKDETFVFEVQFENGEQGTITLDSGAGVHVWPKDRLKDVPTMPRNPGLKMCAANGSEIKNHGRKLIKFRGNDFSKAAAENRVFTRQA